MIKILSKILILFLFSSYSVLLSQNPQDFLMILGDPGAPAMIPKKGKFSAIFNQTQIYRFAGSEDMDSNKRTKISLGLLMNSGLEIKLGKYLNKNEISIDTKGIAYHIKRKKFGVGLHFTSYKHNLTNFYEGKGRETGISIHKRFKKKNVKPFLYYSTILLNPRSDMVEIYNLNSQVEFLSFGLISEINHLVLGTYITAQIEDNFNLNKQSSQFNIILGALLY